MPCWQVVIDIFLPYLYAFAPNLVNGVIIFICELNRNTSQVAVREHISVLIASNYCAEPRFLPAIRTI